MPQAPTAEDPTRKAAVVAWPSCRAGRVVARARPWQRAPTAEDPALMAAVIHVAVTARKFTKINHVLKIIFKTLFIIELNHS